MDALVLPASRGAGMFMQKSAEAIVGAGIGQRAEHAGTRVGDGFSMILMNAQACRQGGALAEVAGQYPVSAA